MNTKKPSLAFVAQRAGDDVTGAGEALCLQAAKHLAPYADIEVLTTCVRDEGSRRNDYPAGHAIVNEVHVNRFPVDGRRSAAAFDVELGSRSTALRNYVRLHQRRFNRIAFFGYRHASTYFTLPLVEEKAVLWPLAHDERPLGLSLWKEFFERRPPLVFSSAQEQQLFARHFPWSSLSGDIVDTGSWAPLSGDAVRFRDRYNVDGPFVLYLGRIEQESGCQTLFDYFLKHRLTATMQRRLVLIGDGPLDVPNDAGVIALGHFDERTTWDAVAAADLIVMPSSAESRSPAVLEAWASGKPVLVNAAAAGTVEECRRANAGLWYSNYDEFAAALDLLTPPLASRLGEQGRRFIERRQGWEESVAAYRRILGC